MSARPPHESAPARTSRRGFFWIPGEVIEFEGQTVQRGPAFVAWKAPAEPTSKLPVVLVHGGGGQGTEWMQTPDGRPGWAPLLVDLGHPVYVIDRPGFGRSPGDPNLTGPTTPPFGYGAARWLFADDATYDRHDAWPWAREPGNAEFDAVVAASAPLILDTDLMNRLDGDRITDLLDIVGRSVIIAASAGGPGSYLATDRRPELVAAFVGIETLGPAFKELGPRGRLDWGLAAAPLTYDPPAASSTDLAVTEIAPADVNPAGNAFVLQTEPARRLPNLARVPVGIFSTDTSQRHLDDEYAVAFLRQAGVDAEQIRFDDHGVTGSGHGIMVETNNVPALRVVLEWLGERLPGEVG